MKKRFNIKLTAPHALKSFIGLETYLSQTSISGTIRELIKIRASQINGCAFCLDIHTQDAIEKGESGQRIFLTNAWREAEGIFSEEEKVVLAMTEEVTLIHKSGLADETYEKALAFFTETQIAELVMAIITINVWNRVALSCKLQIGERLA